MNQDGAGVQGARVTPHNATGAECWAKPLTSANGTGTAVFMINRGAVPADVTCAWEDVAPSVLGPHSSAAVRDLFARADLGTFTGGYTAQGVPAHGSVLVTVIPHAASS